MMREDGIAAVGHLDTLATTLLFGERAFQDGVVSRRTKLLLERFSEAASLVGITVSNEPISWLEKLIWLKQVLMLSPITFKVHFCIPGIAFDSSWMRAEDEEGHPLLDVHCRTKRVKVCIFPALAKQPANYLSKDTDIQAVLVSCK